MWHALFFIIVLRGLIWFRVSQDGFIKYLKNTLDKCIQIVKVYLPKIFFEMNINRFMKISKQSAKSLFLWDLCLWLKNLEFNLCMQNNNNNKIKILKVNLFTCEYFKLIKL